MESRLSVRVHIEMKELGGQIKIDFFSTEDLQSILDLIEKRGVAKKPTDMLEKHIAATVNTVNPENIIPTEDQKSISNTTLANAVPSIEELIPTPEIKKEEPEDTTLYNISNFSL
jgi:hypothetical protein